MDFKDLGSQLYFNEISPKNFGSGSFRNFEFLAYSSWHNARYRFYNKARIILVDHPRICDTIENDLNGQIRIQRLRG